MLYREEGKQSSICWNEKDPLIYGVSGLPLSETDAAAEFLQIHSVSTSVPSVCSLIDPISSFPLKHFNVWDPVVVMSFHLLFTWGCAGHHPSSSKRSVSGLISSWDIFAWKWQCFCRSIHPNLLTLQPQNSTCFFEIWCDRSTWSGA